MRSWSQAEGFEIADDLDVVLPTVDAAMMLRVQAERMGGAFFPSAGEYTRSWGLTAERFALLDSRGGQVLQQPAVMHPGPMNRGLEICDAAADSPHNTVLEQVANGVSIRMAVLHLVLNNDPEA